MANINLFSESPDMRIYSVSENSLPKNTYVLCSQATRDVLYRPYLAGIKLQNQMEKVGKLFVSAVSQVALKGAKREQLAELIYLSGGLYYELNHGFKVVHNFAIPQCFIGIQRQRIEGTQGQFRAVSGYENFESLPDKANIIIGDTVATGSTLIKGIQMLLDNAETKGTSISSISLCTLAGSVVGAQKLAHLAKTHILPQHPKCAVSLFASEMLFHLMPDGTDLRFLESTSIMPEESRKYCLETYGDWLGKNMKCAVFDWGTRCKNPSAHYHEFLEFVDQELKSKKTPQDAKKKLEIMKIETEKGLKEMEKGI